MRLAKGTRAKIVRQFASHDRIGDVFEVAECDSESITLNRCFPDSRSYLHESYTLPTEEFGDFFEVIGMKEPKKRPTTRLLTSVSPKPSLMLSGRSPLLLSISRRI